VDHLDNEKNPAARGKAKRRGRNREEAKASILDDTKFPTVVYSGSKIFSHTASITPLAR
jgi:hypothetical protein